MYVWVFNHINLAAGISHTCVWALVFSVAYVSDIHIYTFLIKHAHVDSEVMS